MIDDVAGADDVAATSAPQQRPQQPQRPKMTIAEQATFMGLLCRRFIQHRDKQLAGEAFITLTRDDMLALENVTQTLLFMEVHRADLLVRDKLSREAQARRRSGG